MVPKRQFYIGIWGLLILVYSWLAYQILAINKIDSNIAVQLTCPSKKWLGLPCPGCGTTRSLLSILSGDLVVALRLNPFGFLALIFLIIAPLLIVYDLVANKQSAWLIYSKTEHILRNKFVLCAVLTIILANWYWNWIKFA